jgi:hypothetical protein
MTLAGFILDHAPGIAAGVAIITAAMWAASRDQN